MIAHTLPLIDTACDRTEPFASHPDRQHEDHGVSTQVGRGERTVPALLPSQAAYDADHGEAGR